MFNGGLALLLYVEQLRSPFLDPLFHFFDLFGKDPGYLVVGPLLYWLRRDRQTFKLVLGMMLCWLLNVILKDLIQQPRPFVTSSLTPMLIPSGTSFPSGHAQTGAFFWTSVALIYSQTWLRVVAAVSILGVGLCRIYLGVHYPHDVVAGWLLGGALAYALFRGPAFGSAITDLWGRRPWLVAITAAILILIVGPMPESPKIAGAILGMLGGYRPRSGPISWSLRERIVTIGIAFVVEVAIYAAVVVGGRMLERPWASVVDFVGLAMLGFWIMRAVDIIDRRKSH